MPTAFAFSLSNILLNPKLSYQCVFSFATVLPDTNHHLCDLSLGKTKVLSLVTKRV